MKALVRIKEFVKRLEDKNIIRIDYSTLNLYRFCPNSNAFIFIGKFQSRQILFEDLALCFRGEAILQNERLPKHYENLWG